MHRSRTVGWLVGAAEIAATSAASQDVRRLNRLQLRLLDACLDELENAHERDESTLNEALARKLRPYVPAVCPGMSITDAIDIVMRQQERYLGPASSEDGDRLPSPVSTRARPTPEPRLLPRPDRLGSAPLEPLDEATARALTDSIRSAGRELCLLMLEAHDRRAWRALGYGTWERYVRREFAISRSRSYELLDQGRVVLAIRAAAGTADVPYVSAYAALQLKPHLSRLLQTVRTETADLAAHEVFHVVGRLIEDFRRRIGQSRTGLASQPPPRPTELSSELQRAVERLSHMPPADEVLRDLRTDEPEWLRSLPDALRWLSEFADASSDRRVEAHRVPVRVLTDAEP